MSFMTKFIGSSALIAGVLAALPAAAVTLGPWSIAGPGTTTVTALGGNAASFSYQTMGKPDSLMPEVYTIETTVMDGGTFDFEWKYSGYHGEDFVMTYLQRRSPGAKTTLLSEFSSDGSSAPANGFSYSGSSSVELLTGDILRFEFGGGGDMKDTHDAVMLSGLLTIGRAPEEGPAPVPVAPAGVLLLSAFGFAATGRRLLRRKG